MKYPAASLLALALTLTAASFSACAGSRGVTATAAPLPADGIPASVTRLSHTVQGYAIAPLDQVTLRTSDATTVVSVSQEGKLDLDATTSVHVLGLTPDALAAAVAKAQKGTKVVQIKEFHTPRITVLGEVFHQIHIEMTEGPMRVLDAIAAANGFTPIANLRRVKVLRENAGTVDVYELDVRGILRGEAVEQNILLLPGDVITVPKNFL